MAPVERPRKELRIKTSNHISRIAVAGAALCALAASAAAQTEKVFFVEDFESLPLGPNVEEGIVTGTGGPRTNVWAGPGVFPPGWTATFSQPGIGVLEWQGWSVASGAWWNLTCGDQDRSNFTVDAGHLSYGACLIADPDEWDDYDSNGLNPDGDGRRFNASITTASFSLSGAVAGTAVLRYFSSWRDEDSMTGVVSVSFDGGPFNVLKTYSSDPNSPDFVNDAPNDVVEFPLNNPGGATSAQIRFELNDAINNWWFAVDSIVVFAESTGPNTLPPAPFFFDVPTFNLTTAAPITWPTVEGATSYTVQLSKTADFDAIEYAFPFNSAGANLPLGATFPGIYYARVVAHNSVGSRISENTIRFVVDRPCLIDMNEDGVTNFFDVQRFLALFSAPCN
ncbi:MAG: hypothetical protein KJZ65_09765 [Phycisphaerales bacterium]|nr:hypothetical protein [Phycisphaerales bacterium]